MLLMASIETNNATELLRAEQRVEAQSAVFRKELGLRDLVLTQIVFVVGSAWVGTAAKLGAQQLVFWLLAMLLFYLPLAAVVIYLNRLMPLEGGLYQWAKFGFNEFAGFMVAWNLWLLGISVMSFIGLVVTTNLSYALDAPWMAESKWLITLVSCLLVCVLVAASLRGLALGKWVHNAGGVMLLATFATLIALPFISHARGTRAEYHPFAFALPALTLVSLKFSLNIFSKLAVGALSGFEYVAILAGECRAPVRNIGRSVLIATPIIALMFILGTSAVLAFVRPADVDLVGPIPQVLSLGFRSFGFVTRIVSITILLLVGRQVALLSIYLTANARLPMVAGWDHLMPAWFTRLHARYKTPVNSIIFIGAVTLAFGLTGIIGVQRQEAFQVLDNAAGVFYALAYVALFALPLFGLRGVSRGAPFWLKLASVAGLLVTLLYTGFTIFPIIDVVSPLAFAAKIICVTVGANLLGATLYLLARRKQRKQFAAAEQLDAA
ncbi:MAG: amino acid permease [Acidobacteria bacterium]|nr:MAG: amino acid permease [Acidobacteriota bacterium]